ncbi:MAG: DUF4240 domain-containing protein [Opitutae bacterium]|nr:DUF4240 domain-containing protein [Opitutae bacterium]
MNRDEFWQLIDSTRPKGLWAALHSGAMEIKLETLSEEEIISFEQHFRGLMAESYRWDLWGAAYIVNRGCSDDGFEYFRAWLISQGKRYYEKCLRNPEAVGARAERDDRTEDEEFMYCAAEAYREKTGRELPSIEVPRSPRPVGETWEESDLPKLFPKLAKKFGLMPSE